MTVPVPRDILIECQGCHVENIFSDYTPDQLIVCNQCRDRLIEPNLKEIYCQYDCQDCGFAVLVLDKTQVKVGESTCRCGSDRLSKIEPIILYEEAQKAGAFDLDEEPAADGDWYRSESVDDEILDYNKIFDNDAGDN